MFFGQHALPLDNAQEALSTLLPRLSIFRLPWWANPTVVGKILSSEMFLPSMRRQAGLALD